MLKLNSIRKFFNLLFFISTALFSAYYFNGCKEQGNISPPPIAPHLSVTHAAPNLPYIDVLVNDYINDADNAYLYTMPYISLAQANLRVRIQDTTNTITFIDTTFFFQDGVYYSFFVCEDTNLNVFPLILTDALSAPGVSNSNVRFIHLSPNTPAIDVGASGKFPWFTNVSFLQFYDFRAITSGTYDLNIYPFGNSTPIYTLGGQSFSQGRIYTIFARGYLGGAPGQELGLTIIQNY